MEQGLKELAGPAVRARSEIICERAPKGSMLHVPRDSPLLAWQIPLLRRSRRVFNRFAARISSGAVRLLAPRLSPNVRDALSDFELIRAFWLPRNRSLWRQTPPRDVHNAAAAARFCISLLMKNPQLRARFPRALSGGGSGDFARWLIDGDHGLDAGSRSFREAVAAAFTASPGEAVRRLFALHTELKDSFPLGLIPAGLPHFVFWLLNHGVPENRISIESIWWFVLESRENPTRELIRTYLVMPRWQQEIPTGVTMFGRRDLASWLSQHYGLAAPWADPRTWPIDMPAAHQIRLAYDHSPDWQVRHPNAIATPRGIRALLTWLRSEQSPLEADVKDWCCALDFEATVTALQKPGVNLLGHFGYVSGLRRSVRCVTECLVDAGREPVLREVTVDPVYDRGRVQRRLGLEIYPITLIHLQPQPFFSAAYSRGGLHKRNPGPYRIAYWYWELGEAPHNWRSTARLVDEIWVATDFVATALRSLGTPVHKLTPGVSVPAYQTRPRSFFGLPDQSFIFLFTFHMASTLRRKNPSGLIDAFHSAFGEDDKTLLVLKVSGGWQDPVSLRELRAQAARRNVVLIDRALSDSDTFALMQLCNCYVSLHRSEGFGLSIAEAMLMGKPAIATGYSGNMEFMTSGNSLPVEFDLVNVSETVGPYPAGSAWADPSVKHAANIMRRVRDDPVLAQKIGAAGRADILRRFSVKAAGTRMELRLKAIEGGLMV